MDVYDQYLENYQDPRAPGYAPRERWTRLAAERRDGADLVSGRLGVGWWEVSLSIYWKSMGGRQGRIQDFSQEWAPSDGLMLECY